MSSARTQAEEKTMSEKQDIDQLKADIAELKQKLGLLEEIEKILGAWEDIEFNKPIILPSSRISSRGD